MKTEQQIKRRLKDLTKIRDNSTCSIKAWYFYTGVLAGLRWVIEPHKRDVEMIDSKMSKRSCQDLEIPHAFLGVLDT